MKIERLWISALAWFVVMAAPTEALAAGSIFTTVSNGTTVNANQYEHKADVYLNGGPQNQNAAGLDVGTYYFQVTNPSGGTLLSSDNAVCRQLTVGLNANGEGVIVGSAGPCPHANGSFNPATGATPVQLIPFDDTPNPGGEYKVWLISQDPSCNTSVDANDPKVLIFDHNCAKTDNFKVRERDEEGPPEEIDVSIGGMKYFDVNANGVNNSEQGIAGWRIDVSLNGNPPISTFTGAGGLWGLFIAPGTSFVACEVMPATNNYIQTGPLVGATSGVATANAQRCWTGTANADVTGLDFGNVCLGAGNAKTKGFWGNKNGQALIGADDLAVLVALNLVDASGSPFDPATKEALKAWLQDANAVNMSFMLSAQLAAMRLNTYNGFVGGGSLVYSGLKPAAPACADISGVNALGFISINDLISEANTELGLDGNTPAGDPERVCQEFKKDALDDANNNTNFVQGQPCPFNY